MKKKLRVDCQKSLVSSLGVVHEKTQHSNVSGAALQMQREMKWFKVLDQINVFLLLL